VYCRGRALRPGGAAVTREDPCARLVSRLAGAPELLPFPAGDDVETVETHISRLLLAGEHVLKFKKPVDFGFLDFSTLARREHFAHEELRLNRRFAPELYLDVLRVTGTPDAPRFGGEGRPLEYAVLMRRFPQAAQLDRELEAGTLTLGDLEAVGREIARWQAELPRAEAADRWGDFDSVMHPVRENFAHLRRELADRPELAARIEPLDTHSEAAGEALRGRFVERRAAGFVREGHGDLHLSNLARLPEGIRAFDCIEFSAELRWIDVVSDLSFLFMDLLARDRSALAWRLVNAWHTASGDWRGLRLLRFYALYRTMVRAKVAALQRGQQEDRDARAALERRVALHLSVGEGLAAAPRPVLVLMHGVSGSGKSHHAIPLADGLGAVHLRSDVERKRLFGLDPLTRGGVDEGLYTPEATTRTYAHLAAITEELLDAGLSVIVDATFLERERRAHFAALGERAAAPVFVVDCEAPTTVLRERLHRRNRRGDDPSDADEAVLDRQEHSREPLSPEESGFTRVAADAGTSPEQLLDQIEKSIARY
jgi:hypothetical protein